MKGVNGRVREWEKVTARVLQEEIIPLCQPALLKRAVSDWEAIHCSRASKESLFNYLLQSTVSSETVETFEGNKKIKGRYFFGSEKTGPGQFNFKRFNEVFDQALRRVYKISTNPDSDITAYVGAADIHTHIPEFLDKNPMHLLAEVAHVAPKIWVGNASLISTHYDDIDNIACVVSGKREFTLFPTEQIRNLYPAAFDKTIAGVTCSLVDVESPDFERHPRYKDALSAAQVATMEPGDALYIPSLWWHNVKAEGDFCVLVNYWWNNPPLKKENPAMAMIHALYTISHLPKKEREAWRALFDYYAFKVEGEPHDHLQEEDRGVLGEMTPELMQTLKNHMSRRMGIKLHR